MWWTHVLLGGTFSVVLLWQCGVSGVGLGLCVCGCCIGFDVVCELIRWVRRRIVGICEAVALLSAFRLVVSVCLDCRCGCPL